jgi:hypothetical protein
VLFQFFSLNDNVPADQDAFVFKKNPLADEDRCPVHLRCDTLAGHCLE